MGQLSNQGPGQDWTLRPRGRAGGGHGGWRGLRWRWWPFFAADFFGVGGWYFARQIESGALAVKPTGPLPTDNDVRVVGVSGGQIRPRAIGDQPALAKPMLFGIAWPGGFGRLGAAVPVSGSVVTRPLT